MYFKIEKYMVQFFLKRIIRSGLLREYLFFNVISLLLISGLLVPFIYSLLYAIIIIIALTNNLFTDSAGIAKLKWMAANFIISAITGLAAFYSKRCFLKGISVASVLIIILIVSILSLFITSQLFISLLR